MWAIFPSIPPRNLFSIKCGKRATARRSRLLPRSGRPGKKRMVCIPGTPISRLAFPAAFLPVAVIESLEKWKLEYRYMAEDAQIRLGTSAFTAAGWESSFYPAGMKPAEYLTYYATKFDTVEVDSTFYRAPSASTVEGWARKTPENFIFAVKVPQSITHEKILADCDAEFTQFVKTMEILG